MQKLPDLPRPRFNSRAYRAFHQVFTRLVGDYRERSMECRLFNVMALFNGVANIAGAPFMLELPNGELLCALHLLAGLGFLGFYAIARFAFSYEKLYWPFILLMAIFVSINAVENAASMGGAHYYLIMGMVIAVILARNWRRTMGALAVFALATTSVFWIEYVKPEWVVFHDSTAERWEDVFGNFLFVLTFTGLVVMVLVDTLDRERALSDKLLRNVLPEKIAEELKHYGKSAPRNYESATVLFTDISGFTRMAEDTPPETLVKDLDVVFRAFDEICRTHNVSRIKTIGDAYMAAGGVPEPNDTHPHDVVSVGVAMLKCMKEINTQRLKAGKELWEMRIGIHTGSVSGGVVGIDKFAYDLWGDTVNVASRMESNSEPGRINISEATHALVGEHFKTTPRGELPVKNRGVLKMYFVEADEKDTE